MISLYTGAMGLDLGFEMEGFETKVIVESDRAAVDTIRANRPNIPVSLVTSRTEANGLPRSKRFQPRSCS